MRNEWRRGYVNMLETAPAFNMFVDVFVLSGLGSILTASPGSNMTWGVGTWNGVLLVDVQD